MDIDQLIGCKIDIVGEDPVLFSSGASAEIRAADAKSQTLLLVFIPTVRVGGQNYQFAVATGYLDDDNLGKLIKEGTLGCRIKLIPSDRYDASRPLDVTWWRGGAAAIGTLVFRKEEKRK